MSDLGLILVLIGIGTFVLVRDYILDQRKKALWELMLVKLLSGFKDLFRGGVMIGSQPQQTVPPGEKNVFPPVAPNELGGDENTMDLQDMKNFDLPRDFGVQFEEGPPEEGVVRGEV